MKSKHLVVLCITASGGIDGFRTVYAREPQAATLTSAPAVLYLRGPGAPTIGARY